MSEPRSFGFLQLWDAVADAVPERECIVQGERRLTWAAMRDRTTRLGWWLTGHGLGARDGAVADWESPNDLVGLLLRNSPEYLEGSLGAYRARCAPFNVNYRYQADELAYLLTDAQPGAVIYHHEFGDVLQGALELSGASPLLIRVGEGDGLAGSHAYESVLASAVAPERPVVPSPDDVHVLYTGGTTGMPKGVIWRLRNLAGHACGISVESLEAARRDAPRRGWLRALPLPPLMHGTAAWFAYNAWSRGGTLVLSEDRSFDAAGALALMREERVTWTAIVGDAFARPLLRAIDEGEVAPQTLSYIFSSGAVLSEVAWTQLEHHFPGLKLVNALGSSETGPQAFQTASGQAEFSAGPATVVVSDDYGSVLSAATPGVGWLANGGELPRGYLNDAERTMAVYRVVDGQRLSVSGDRAAIDASGAITFLGRGSGVINSAGEKIHAEEVESVLCELPHVDEALVFGRPNEEWGQEVVALLVSRSGEKPARDVLRAASGDRLSGYKFPRAVAWVPEIRRHDNGKPDYAWARDVLAAP